MDMATEQGEKVDQRSNTFSIRSYTRQPPQLPYPCNGGGGNKDSDPRADIKQPTTSATHTIYVHIPTYCLLIYCSGIPHNYPSLYADLFGFYVRRERFSTRGFVGLLSVLC